MCTESGSGTEKLSGILRGYLNLSGQDTSTIAKKTSSHPGLIDYQETETSVLQPQETGPTKDLCELGRLFK